MPNDCEQIIRAWSFFDSITDVDYSSSKSRRVPRQMINKRDAAWTAHETTRRRIDWYMVCHPSVLYKDLVIDAFIVIVSKRPLHIFNIIII